MRGAHLPSISHWAHNWINHWSLWDTRPVCHLLSQSKGIIALWPAPIYTAWCQRHMCVNNLSKEAKVVIWKRNGRKSNCDSTSRESNAITTTSSGQIKLGQWNYSWLSETLQKSICHWFSDIYANKFWTLFSTVWQQTASAHNVCGMHDNTRRASCRT